MASLLDPDECFLKIQDNSDVEKGVDVLMGRVPPPKSDEVHFSYGYLTRDAEFRLPMGHRETFEPCPMLDVDPVLNCNRGEAKRYADFRAGWNIPGIADAIIKCKVLGLHLKFSFCNLSEESVIQLAEALEKNTTLKGFSCLQNPCSFPDGVNYDPNAPCEIRMKQALILTKAPIEIWNDQPLPSDLIEACRVEAVRRAEAEFESEHPVIFELLTRANIFDRVDRRKYAEALLANDLHRIDRVAKVEKSDLVAIGISLGDAIDILDMAKQMVNASTGHAKRNVNPAEIIKHLLFFSYAQKDCAGETYALANHAAIKYSDHSIFRDADVKFKLNELVEHVKQSKNVIVVLSENYPRRPFTLVELHTAIQAGLNIVAVRATRSGLNQFNFEQVQKDITNGNIRNYLDDAGWKTLREYKMDVNSVANDLKAVMNVAASSLDMLASRDVIAAMAENVLKGVTL